MGVTFIVQILKITPLTFFSWGGFKNQGVIFSILEGDSRKSRGWFFKSPGGDFKNQGGDFENQGVVKKTKGVNLKTRGWV